MCVPGDTLSEDVRIRHSGILTNRTEEKQGLKRARQASHPDGIWSTNTRTATQSLIGFQAKPWTCPTRNSRT
jgi:hypothetical protein